MEFKIILKKLYEGTFTSEKDFKPMSIKKDLESIINKEMLIGKIVYSKSLTSILPFHNKIVYMFEVSGKYSNTICVVEKLNSNKYKYTIYTMVIENDKKNNNYN